MNETERFIFSAAAAGTSVPWDQWESLAEIAARGDRKAFLNWLVRNDSVLVDSTYPCKSVLLDIALSLLAAAAAPPEPPPDIFRKGK